MKTKQELCAFFRQYTRKGVGQLLQEIWERTPAPTTLPVFNLTEEDTETTNSLKRLYLEYYKDPMEITFVDKVMGGRFDLWRALSKHAEVSKYIDAWREEARARYLADNFKEIQELARNSDVKTSMAALKYMTDKVFDTGKNDVTRGRPSKKQLEQATRNILSEDEDIKEAFARVQGTAYC